MLAAKVWFQSGAKIMTKMSSCTGLVQISIQWYDQRLPTNISKYDSHIIWITSIVSSMYWFVSDLHTFALRTWRQHAPRPFHCRILGHLLCFAPTRHRPKTKIRKKNRLLHHASYASCTGLWPRSRSAVPSGRFVFYFKNLRHLRPSKKLRTLQSCDLCLQRGK